MNIWSFKCRTINWNYYRLSTWRLCWYVRWCVPLQISLNRSVYSAIYDNCKQRCSFWSASSRCLRLCSIKKYILESVCSLSKCQNSNTQPNSTQFKDVHILRYGNHNYVCNWYPSYISIWALQPSYPLRCICTSSCKIRSASNGVVSLTSTVSRSSLYLLTSTSSCTQSNWCCTGALALSALLYCLRYS